MKLKKVLSIFLSVSMMLSIMPNVFAAGDDRLVDGTSKAKISCELFKYKEGFDDDNAENQTGSTTPLVEKMTALSSKIDANQIANFSDSMTAYTTGVSDYTSAVGQYIESVEQLASGLSQLESSLENMGASTASERGNSEQTGSNFE
mgnify:CR=1 FL=1